MNKRGQKIHKRLGLLKALKQFLTPFARLTVKRSTDRGRGVKGAPSASIDTSLIAEGTTDVK